MVFTMYRDENQMDGTGTQSVTRLGRLGFESERQQTAHKTLSLKIIIN